MMFTCIAKNSSGAINAQASSSVSTGPSLLSNIELKNCFGSITRKISSLTSSMRAAVVSGTGRCTGLIAGVVVCGCGVAGIAALQRWLDRNEDAVNNKDCEDPHSRRKPVSGRVDPEDDRTVVSYINNLYRKVVILERGLKKSWSSEQDLKRKYYDNPSKVKTVLEDNCARRDDVSSIRASLKKFLDHPNESRYPIIKSSTWKINYSINSRLISRPKKDEIVLTLKRAVFLKEVKSMESRINKYREIFISDGKNELDTDEIFSISADAEIEREKKSGSK